MNTATKKVKRKYADKESRRGAVFGKRYAMIDSTVIGLWQMRRRKKHSTAKSAVYHDFYSRVYQLISSIYDLSVISDFYF